jgi:hypothetical protein
VVITWDDAQGETGYSIDIANQLGGRLDADVTSYTWENVPCGMSASVLLIAWGADGAEMGRLTTTVDTPACGAQSQTVTLQSLPAEDGHAVGRDAGQSANLSGNIPVGDSDQNRGLQGFFSFDISGIPQGATLQEVNLDLSNFQRQGQPLNSLGQWRIYAYDYGELGPEDFNTDWNADGSFVTSDSAPGVFQPIRRVQNLVNNGATRFRIRVQFRNATDDDSQADVFIFREGSPALTITYVP